MTYFSAVDRSFRIAGLPQKVCGTRTLATITFLACCAAATSASAGGPQNTAALAPNLVPTALHGEQNPDKLLAMDVSAALAADPLFHGTHYPVTVAVDKGTVLLRGIVYDEPWRAHAAKVAQTIPGVKSVVNDLQTVTIHD